MEKVFRHRKIENKWRNNWEKDNIYSTPKSPKSKSKNYMLGMFPYPSGAGLHVGHTRIYTAVDVMTRYFRMKGDELLCPIGWDSFGLPAENAAIKEKISPKVMVPRNEKNFKKQCQMIGFSYDWDYEVSTSDPDYYKWTQWIFLKLYEMKNEKGERLIYRKEVPINWCPSCKTGLSDEEVLNDGTHERCGSEVSKKDLKQWIFRITDYADQLLTDLKGLDWPKGILDMQKNWIGRSEGINFKHKVKDMDIEFEVYDSIPQTFMAQTFVIIAPEHPFVAKMVKGTKYEKKVTDFVEKVKRNKLKDKYYFDKEMEGIFTGRYSENYMGTDRNLPIWVANFALMDYGTGIVGCSAHDERDFKFAKKYDLPLKPVLFPKDKKHADKVKNLEVFYREPDGIIQEPAEFKGKRWDEIGETIIKYIVKEGLGRKTVNYKLRDWIFSRQRYWGEPIPLVHCDKCGDENGVVPLTEDQLPLELPDVKSYEPTGTGESPLANIEDWVAIKCPKCKGPAKRETDTMPNWAGSCWYFLRFAIGEVKSQKSKVKNLSKIWEEEFMPEMKKWMPVDWYLGGAEHAVLHLLYARFWVKALKDLKLVENDEPFTRLRSVGLVLAEDGRKMSKSFGNVINPDDVVEAYGADTLRVYTMFMGPWGQTIAWSTSSVLGARRFVEKVWKLSVEGIAQGFSKKTDQKLQSKLHQTIKKITEDIENLKFNTCISSLMELVNTWETLQREGNSFSKSDFKAFLKVVSPFAPFITDELWEQLGEKKSIHQSDWPKYKKDYIQEETLNIIVQVNGKLRGKLEIDKESATKKEVTASAKQVEGVAKFLDGKKVKNTIYVPQKLINFVTD